jgi:hypothetical protein
MHKKNLYPAALDFQLKRKKRERRKKKEVGIARGLGSLTLPDLAAGSRRLAAGTRRPWVSQTHGLFFFFVLFCFFFCFSGHGSQTHGLFCFSSHGSRSTSPSPSLCPDTSRQPTSQQVDDQPPKPTTGSRRPWIWFFLSFKMIKSQKG